eukprot:TRINITY_DN10166_c0_g1_i1.p1 TRINITY_DN10166_c0_g1~~TRINITY_DN10166_c0_g1_i1.p1  ORF type:complete len:212 (-),score=32.72 TRINITY_DN10166_c0_g1_i1:26-661(-)
MCSLVGNETELKWVSTCISSNLCETWDGEYGLRELVQNQRDALVLKYGIETISYVHSKENFVIKCKNSDEVGAIEFIDTKEEKERYIFSMWNYGDIHPNAFLYGNSDKRTNVKLLGKFGTGLKDAVVKFLELQANYFAIYSNSCSRIFRIRNEELQFAELEKNPEYIDKVVVMIESNKDSLIPFLCKSDNFDPAWAKDFEVLIKERRRDKK